MAINSPVFPITEPHHFSDYGFDPQIDYFQVLEEAKRHKREPYFSRSIDTLHFKLQKPISKDDPYHLSKKKKKSAAFATKKRRWWKNALLFFKSKWAPLSTRPINPATSFGPTSISGPIYITESLSGSVTPSRPTTSRQLTPARRGEVAIPYVSLRELNMDQPHMPIYLVT